MAENENISIIEKIPIWVIGVSIIGVIVFILLLFFSQKPFNCNMTKDGFSCGFVSDTNVTHDKYFGYFYDWDEKKRTYCSYEIVDITFSDDELSVQAKTTGKVKDRDGSLVERSWIHRGYKHGNNLAISYVTESKPTTGNGVYYLVQNQGDYAGFWVGVDWPSGKIIHCPYLLTKTEKRGNESCEDRWPQIFSKSNACIEVKFE